MTDYTIYHNPRCSKSRTTLALLREHGIDPDIVLYLDEPLGADQINSLLAKLGLAAGQLVRRGEEAYKSSGLNRESAAGDLVAAMVAHPKLIERPIVVRGERAVLGRPPENILALLD